MPPDRPLRADAQRNRTRILEAAEQIFGAKGASASTEEIAQAAGVGIGTVFRHFPTKADLLEAIVKERGRQLFADAETLMTTADPGEAFFTFFRTMVEQAASKKTIVELLASTGRDIMAEKPVERLESVIAALLRRAQKAGTVRKGIRVPEVMALLTGTCQAAIDAGWDKRLRERTLAIVFAGMRP